MRLGSLVLAALLVTSCAAGVGAPVGTGPLVTITTRGGECMEGPCGSTIVIERDGVVHQTAPTATELGTVPDDVLAALDAGIKTTDFAVVRAVPFTGECPVNFDGQEWIYEFAAPAGVERIASCETEVDPAHPVFAAVEAALASIE